MSAAIAVGFARLSASCLASATTRLRSASFCCASSRTRRSAIFRRTRSSSCDRCALATTDTRYGASFAFDAAGLARVGSDIDACAKREKAACISANFGVAMNSPLRASMLIVTTLAMLRSTLAVNTTLAQARSVTWFTTGSGVARSVDGLNNTEWAKAHGTALSGYTVGFGCWGVSDDSLRFTTKPGCFSHIVVDPTLRLPVIPVGAVSDATLLALSRNASAMQSMASGAVAATKAAGWAGLQVDNEDCCDGKYGVALPNAYADFIGNMTAAMKTAGLRFEVDVDIWWPGDLVGPLHVPTYAARGATIMMMTSCAPRSDSNPRTVCFFLARR